MPKSGRRRTLPCARRRRRPAPPSWPTSSPLERAASEATKRAEAAERERDALREQVGGPEREAFNEALIRFDPTQVGRHYLISATEMVERAEQAESTRDAAQARAGELLEARRKAEADLEVANLNLSSALKQAEHEDARADAAEAQIKRLGEALERALALIDHAEGKDAHGPWCNGTHEQCLCEGQVQAERMIAKIRALAPPDTRDDKEPAPNQTREPEDKT